MNVSPLTFVVGHAAFPHHHVIRCNSRHFCVNRFVLSDAPKLLLKSAEERFNFRLRFVLKNIPRLFLKVHFNPPITASTMRRVSSTATATRN